MSDTIQTSPVPAQNKLLTMSFSEAIAVITLGGKMTRIDWNDKEEYGFLKNEYLHIHTKGKAHQWLVSESDMKATDWFVLRDEKGLNA